MNDDNKHTYCRLCLCKIESNDAIHLLASSWPTTKHDKSSKTLLDQINKLFPIRLSQYDGYSLYICSFCNTQIQDFERYVETIVRNQQELEKQKLEVPVLDEPYDDIKQFVCEVKPEPENFGFDPVDNDDFEEDDLEEEWLSPAEEENKDFACELCGTVMATKVGLAIHMKRKHKTVQQWKSRRQIKSEEGDGAHYECDLCCLVFTSKNLIQNHMLQNHIFGAPFACSSCDKIFNSKQQLRYHRRIHKRQGKVKENAEALAEYLKCELCNNMAYFATFSDLVTHFQDEHQTKGYVRCCNKQFFTRKSVVNHDNQHRRPTDFMCKICNKMLPNQYSLRDHVARHGDDTEKKHCCNICEKRFHLKYDLTDHVRRKHTKKEEGPSICQICDKK